MEEVVDTVDLDQELLTLSPKISRMREIEKEDDDLLTKGRKLDEAQEVLRQDRRKLAEEYAALRTDVASVVGIRNLKSWL